MLWILANIKVIYMVWLFSLNLNRLLFYTCCLLYTVSDCFIWFKNSAFKRNSESSPDIFWPPKKFILVSVLSFGQCSNIRKLLFWNKANLCFPWTINLCIYFTIGKIILYCTCSLKNLLSTFFKWKYIPSTVSLLIQLSVQGISALNEKDVPWDAFPQGSSL